MISITDPQTGIKYRSLSAAARAIGVSKDALLYRVAQGYSPDMIFYRGNIHYTRSRDHLGREYRTFAAMAEAWGLKPRTAAARLRKGLTIEQALRPSRKRSKGGQHEPRY